jgi:hypothetical protein
LAENPHEKVDEISGNPLEEKHIDDIVEFALRDCTIGEPEHLREWHSPSVLLSFLIDVAVRDLRAKKSGKKILSHIFVLSRRKKIPLVRRDVTNLNLF